MNTVLIKIGQYYSPEYSEFLFKTYYSKQEIYDENFNLTKEFQKWLMQNHNDIYTAYIIDRDNFEISYFDTNDIEIIVLDNG